MTTRGNKIEVNTNVADLRHEERLDYIIDKIISGKSKSNIIRDLQSEWGFSRNTLYAMFKEAVIRMADLIPEDKREFQLINYTRLYDLYDSKISTKEKLKIIDLINRMAGIYEQNINIGNKEDEVIRFDLGVENG